MKCRGRVPLVFPFHVREEGLQGLIKNQVTGAVGFDLEGDF